MIICDDCSSDATLQIIGEFQKTAPFSVKVYKNKRNLGATKNFEKAINLCSGDIIALSDQDDVWMPSKLEVLEQKLITSPRSKYVFSDALVVNENLSFLGFTVWDRISFTKKEREVFVNDNQIKILLKRNVVTGATLMFRKKYIHWITPIPKQWVHDAWIAILLSANKNGGSFVETPLIKYRQHPEQLIGARKTTFKELMEGLSSIKMEFYIKNIELLTQLLKRIESQNRIEEDIKDIINEKILHLKNRKKIQNNDIVFLQKIQIILGELFSGRYNRHSSGIKSAIRDLIIKSKSK